MNSLIATSIARTAEGSCAFSHADPDVKAKLEAQGFDVSGQSGPEFAADIKVQAERWARLVRASGFKADSRE